MRIPLKDRYPARARMYATSKVHAARLVPEKDHVMGEDFPGFPLLGGVRNFAVSMCNFSLTLTEHQMLDPGTEVTCKRCLSLYESERYNQEKRARAREMFPRLFEKE